MKRPVSLIQHLRIVTVIVLLFSIFGCAGSDPIMY